MLYTFMNSSYQSLETILISLLNIKCCNTSLKYRTAMYIFQNITNKNYFSTGILIFSFKYNCAAHDNTWLKY